MRWMNFPTLPALFVLHLLRESGVELASKVHVEIADVLTENVGEGKSTDVSRYTIRDNGEQGDVRVAADARN